MDKTIDLIDTNSNLMFEDLTFDELSTIDGGLVILGAALTAKKVVTGVLVTGGVLMFAKGVYDGYKGK